MTAHNKSINAVADDEQLVLGLKLRSYANIIEQMVAGISTISF